MITIQCISWLCECGLWRAGGKSAWKISIQKDKSEIIFMSAATCKHCTACWIMTLYSSRYILRSFHTKREKLNQHILYWAKRNFGPGGIFGQNLYSLQSICVVSICKVKILSIRSFFNFNSRNYISYQLYSCFDKLTLRNELSKPKFRITIIKCVHFVTKTKLIKKKHLCFRVFCLHPTLFTNKFEQNNELNKIDKTRQNVLVRYIF